MRKLSSSVRAILCSAIEPLEQRRLLSGPEVDTLDFGDAPDSYGTLLASNGARHTATPNLLLGTLVDVEADGQPNAAASGDDIAPAGAADDEDGVVFLNTLVQGDIGSVQVHLGAGSGRLNAWIDFDGNGTFDPADQIFTNVILPNGTSVLSFAIPTTAAVGQTYARFRLSQAGATGAVSPIGDGGFGEVEDYSVRILEGPDIGLDFGDAPQSATGGPPNYPTLLASNGARHVITPNGPRLGPTIDREPDGQPNLTANGDDLSVLYGGIDDEDGVHVGGVPLELVPLDLASIAPVQVSNGGGNGLLNAWFDWNQNGVWGDIAIEQVATNLPIAGGATVVVNVNVPNFIPVGTNVYSRFRISTTAGLTPVGPASNGEVEDYVNRIRERQNATLDFGDAPDTYRTTLTLNGARHTATPNLRLGAFVDAELDGQPSANAQRDDANGVPDDEDGVSFLTSLVQGNLATVQVSNGGGAGVLNAWVDFNANGVFEPVEQVFTNVALAAASVNNLNFLVPASAAAGGSYARFRLSLPSGGVVGPAGFGGFGEVEDYEVKIENAPTPRMDFGDAPDTYRTTLALNGARHAASPNIRLGAFVDAEPDGQPSAAAQRDDANGVPDDEDGVTFTSPLVPGALATVTVINGAAASRLNAWMDFNANGIFDAGEQIFTNVALPAASVNPLAFVVPAGTLPGVSYARFRVNQAGGLAPFGFGGFGEVEDYRVEIVEQPDPRFDFGDAPDDPAAGFNYHTLLANAGARHLLDPKGPRLGGRFDVEADGQPSPGANRDDANNIDDEDGVRIGGVPIELVPLALGGVVPIQVTNGGPSDGLLQAWFDWNQNGAWDAAEQVATNVPVPAGTTIVLNVAVPNAIPAVTQVYSRFRLSTTANLGHSGPAQDGEVEDYVNKLQKPPQEERMDFGDAPDAPGTIFKYPTIFAGLSGDPARHIIQTVGPRLGPTIDPEPDGQPNLAASGDDIGLLYGGIDDEDGITIGGAPLDTVPLIAGSVMVLEVSNPTGVAGLLNAWFDWNQDGDWDASEQVATDVPVPPGVTLLPVAIPAGLKQDAQIYSRFRIDTAGGLKPSGIARDGEVEDYVNRVIPDVVPPHVVAGTLEFETRQAITLTFSEPLDPTSVQATDLTALNTDDGSTPVAVGVILSAGNTMATWVFNSPGNILSDGDYDFNLAAGAVADVAGNGLAPAFNLSGPGIFFNAGDANRDRVVDVADLGTLASNWQQSPRTFSQGNFDYDAFSIVDVNDLGILASNWQQILLAPVPSAPSPFASTGRRIDELFAPAEPVLDVVKAPTQSIRGRGVRA